MKTSEQTKRAISVGLATTALLIMVAATTLFCGVTSARAQEPDNRIDWRWGRPGVMVVTNAPTAVTVTNIATEVATEVASGVANTLFGPRVTALEGALDGNTNNWDTAYGWGDHALAGYLANETDAIALAVMATNRTTVVFNPTNSNEFTDGAMRVWRIDTVTNTFIGWSVVIETPISICGEVIQPSTNQWPGIPYPLWTDSALSFTQFITNYPAGSTQPMVVWYYYRTGRASPHEVHFSSPAEESSANWHSNYGSSSAGASPRGLLGQDDGSPTWSWVSMIYGTNTTVSVVTSQVATVAWQSDLSPYATTQAVAGKVDTDGGAATNLWLQGETIVSDSYTNLWWRNVYSNGWHWLVAYTNAPGGGE